MTLSVNAKTYTADSFGSNVVGYFGPGKTVTVKDNVAMTRQLPSPSAVFSGVSRTSCKLTRTLTLTGALTPTGDAFCRIECMIPVGAASADIDTLLNDMGAFLASATFKTHVKTPAISF